MDNWVINIEYDDVVEKHIVVGLYKGKYHCEFYSDDVAFETIFNKLKDFEAEIERNDRE